MFEFLAGPIIRRVTENRVCIWLAAATPALLKLSITDSTGALLGVNVINDTQTYRSKLGQNLYIYLLQAQPTGNEFPTDTLLYYHIAQITEDNTAVPFDFQQLGLTYANEKHPSFFLAAKLQSLLYGSCRKPHGLEELLRKNPGLKLSDALSRGDDELANTYTDISQRPPLLILGGDQIYADDVAASLLDQLKVKATQLLGYEETIPSLAAKPAQIPLNERTPAAKQAGFSSDAASNHLLGFGEFAAMYIYVFGNAQKWQLDTTLETDPARKQALEDFHSNLPSVRRLFANIPTYMIFDDHDVTDDWNITGAWYDRVRTSPVGRRVTANALAAYWAFQGWGNDPETFDPDIRWATESFLTNADLYTGALADRFDLQLWKHRGWSFSVPTSPPIICIDSRTQRQPVRDFDPPQLLDRYALDWLRVEWLKLQTRPHELTGWPIFIATTPVMGFAPVEWLESLLLWGTGVLENNRYIRMLEELIGKEGYLAEKIIEKLDAEAWTSNLEGFEIFLSTLSSPDSIGLKHCVFLSGDVHYAFSVNASFQKDQQTPLQCIQLTSTAFCNIPDEKSQRALNKMAKIAALNQGKSEHSAPPIWPWKAWRASSQILPAANQHSAITELSNIGLVKFDAEGKPILHRLLTGDGQAVDYPLPPAEFS